MNLCFNLKCGHPISLLNALKIAGPEEAEKYKRKIKCPVYGCQKD
jgi:hypothetical protein